ncbi:hypothetical protein FRX31_030649 [Thalictrum thalictroides]|uniref:Uncharacterized protein n=1 Tax=Thalictrum thalictroides TaxID=46969 RepID=A0A7J6V4C2_THATH|nr:hypothetical protein FRX31_030649 [Thalictrum thalictroides]
MPFQEKSYPPSLIPQSTISPQTHHQPMLQSTSPLDCSSYRPLSSHHPMAWCPFPVSYPLKIYCVHLSLHFPLRLEYLTLTLTNFQSLGHPRIRVSALHIVQLRR